MDNNQVTNKQNNIPVVNNTTTITPTVPIANENKIATPVQPQQPPETVITPIQSNNVIQQQIQGVPTVEQSKEEFIDNTQALTPEKKEEKQNGVNYVFMVILFVIIFGAIFFLFPLLLKHI